MTTKPMIPGDGPWFIWSHKHGMWHWRDDIGNAAGYTSDILLAGLFERQTAEAYHEGCDSSARSIEDQEEMITEQLRLLDIRKVNALILQEHMDAINARKVLAQ